LNKIPIELAPVSASAVVLMLIALSCSRVELNTQASGAHNAVARLYIGLASRTNEETFETGLVQAILDKHFEGATIEHATGVYHGNAEESVIVTVINCCRWEIPEKEFRQKINNLAEDIKNTLDQESVLVEYINSNGGSAFEVYD